MANLSPPIQCLAVDFGGTLAARFDDAIDGTVIARALGEVSGWAVPDTFTNALNCMMEISFQRDRAASQQTSFPDILRATARECGAVLPDNAEVIARQLFDRLPDARVDPSAARAVRTLAKQGFRLVLASNTRWPESARRRTLDAAGIGDCFHALVLSSALGLRKPHPRFYEAVLGTVGCPPGAVLFVGDTADKDIDPPLLLGMQALLVAPVWAHSNLIRSGLPMFKDIPGLLGTAR